MSKISLSFYGGAREVTGSCYLLEFEGHKILIDCGMFQGARFAEERNCQNLPFDAAEVEAVFVTHSHMDHIGRLPVLYRRGFRGKIYATAPTRDLAEVMLEDGQIIVQKEAERHHDDPCYRKEDVEGAVSLFRSLPYYETIAIGNATFKFLNAGHILGSAFVRIEYGSKNILFTGDIGNDTSVLLPHADVFTDINTLIIESVYGDRVHKYKETRSLLLERAIEDTVSRGGVLMMPIFATERTQEILFEINEMLEYKRIPPIPVFVDSPLAIKATEVFKKYPEYYNEAARNRFEKESRLFDFKNLKFTSTKEESIAINDVRPPKIILAGSGMSTGGRIWHHEVRYLSDPKSILMIVGYQTAGSLGRRLLQKTKEVMIRGQMVEVRAEVRVIDGYSAHADQDKLMRTVLATRDSLEKMYVIHGEDDAALNFAQLVKDRYGVSAEVPTFGQKVEL